jgi:RNA polymerase sigma factor (sigma-70 family)
MHPLTRKPLSWLKPDQQMVADTPDVIDYLRTILERRQFRPDEVEDPLHEAFLRGLQWFNRGLVTAIIDCKELLAGIACESAIRDTSRLRRTVYLGRIAEPASPPEPEEEGEALNMRPLQAALIQEVRIALGLLSVKQQVAICLYYLEGLTVREIADRQGVRMATVSRNKALGLAKLRRLLADIVPPALLRNRRFER